MAAEAGEQVYATLLLNDSYLPGALVLGHSLRDARATRKLAVLVTTDTVSSESLDDLKTVYDHVIPVPRIRNDANPANLHLMNRSDLHSAFTKINLWKQTQFSKIVYIDADVVAYRAPDELFNIAHPFSAAPDIGWPDLFNTGVMVLTPNMGDYHAMLAMAERGISFDGADQGMLNMHFGNNYNRLSFTYNVTPSAHYQYVPAYRHFQSSINMVHFIGANKPWFAGRNSQHGSTPFNEMVGRWWAVYDRHYHGQGMKGVQPGNSNGSGSKHSSQSSWDAQRHPPPANSRPEAMNFPNARYNMSQDTTPFKSPHGYSRQAYNPLQNLPDPIFPWEANRPMPSRQFPDDELEISSPISQAPSEITGEPSSPGTECTEATDTTDGTTTFAEPTTPTTPTMRGSSSDLWNAFGRNNAWDSMPEISRYIDGVQNDQRTKSGGLRGLTIRTSNDSQKLHPGSKVTDFPSEVERPSLPVTPAPVQRESYFGQNNGNNRRDAGETPRPLPSAAGVPAQADWDPQAQLQMLVQNQHGVLLQKLHEGSEQVVGGEAKEMPTRHMPFGSEEFKPTTSYSGQKTDQSNVGVKGDSAEEFDSSRVRIASSEDGY